MLNKNMEFKRYSAPNINIALDRIKEELGEEALVLSTHTRKNLVEVVVAVGAENFLPLQYSSLFQRMQSRGIRESAALKVLLNLKKIVDY